MARDVDFRIRENRSSDHWELTPVQREALSHRIRKRSSDSSGDPYKITSDVLAALRAAENLYDPMAQATDLIRYIGDQVSKTGISIRQMSATEIRIQTGSPSEELAAQLIHELSADGVVTFNDMSTLASKAYAKVDLTLDGWKQYAAEKRGLIEGNYGFMAMKFFNDDERDDIELEEFVESVVKPAVKEATGCDLVDMRDVGRAGVIDNIMRIAIRDSKFVISDLTHDNNGAYWEAGYAEGLGKPVIYICEKEKFEAKKTHFDTNHCTTVPWSRDDEEGFRRELAATLRRSLEQSP